MQKNRTVSPIKKTLPALIAGVSMTIFIGLAILAFGLNALFNQKVNVAQAQAQTQSQSDSQVTLDQAALQDLQAKMLQYQDREAQYQNELQQAADQINQVNQQNQQYRQLIQALQNAGVIQITPDGQVFITQSAGFPSGFEHDDD